jgi:hypothetical protein
MSLHGQESLQVKFSVLRLVYTFSVGNIGDVNCKFYQLSLELVPSKILYPAMAKRKTKITTTTTTQEGMLLTCIREVSRSNLGLDIDCAQ